MQGLQYRNSVSVSVSAALQGASLKSSSSIFDGEAEIERIRKLTSENAVMVFSMTSCCMCHVVKRLLCGLGVNPTVCELDEQAEGAEMEKALVRLLGQKTAVPAVFIGGKLVGGLDRLMSMHISGDLVPKLKLAGALWL